MESTLLCVLLLLNTHINSGHSEDDDGVAKAVLTIHPNSSQIFSGESVTLRCVIQGGGVTDWEYTWLTPSPDQCPQKKHECIISAAEFSQSGDYSCLGSHQQQYSKWSDAVRLTVTPLPKATLTVKPNPVFPGETVTLKCSVESDSIWSYQWYKDRNDTVLPQSGRHTITGDTLTINGETVNEGPYWCQGKRESTPTSSSISDPVTIIVNALPRASVSISPQGPLYSGETVSLQCVIPDYTDWTYYWFRDNQHLPSQTSKVLDITIPITLTGQAGQYRCEGLRTDRPQRSQPSDDVTISVNALPKATLTVKPNPVFPGETVTLKCSVGSDSSWIYKWYKDRNYKVASQSGYRNIGVSHTISRAGVSDQGQYWCEGNRVSRPTSSQPSDPVTLTVKALPKTTLTIEPNPAYTGEKVTLTCSVGSDSSWSYKWYKDRNDNVVSQSGRHTITGDTLTINGATVNEGPYWCQGKKESRPTSSSISDPVTIIVNDNRPTATLSSDKENVFTGDRVTLSCTVKSPGWKFYWYRHRPDSIPVTTTSGYSYTLSWVSVSDGGQYWCRAGRGDPVYYTLYSDPVQINITVSPGSVVSISLPRLLCGLLVMSPFLLVSIVLTVKCCRARGLCSTVKSPQDQIPCDDVIEQNE